MVKTQIHEEFVSFTGASIPELSKLVADYVTTNKLAPKSLSVLNYFNKFIASIGYRTDETGYAVSIESTPLNAIGADLDERINKAEAIIGGDAICHSLFIGLDGLPYVAFLVHVGTIQVPAATTRR